MGGYSLALGSTSSSEAPGALAAASQARRRTAATYFVGALLVAAFGPVAALINRERAAELIGLSLLWALHVAVVGGLVRWRTLSIKVGGLVSSAGGVLFLPAILMRAAGGPLGPLSTVLICMPLVIAAVAPDDRGAVLVFAAGALGWLGVEALLHPAGWATLGAAVLSLALSAIAVLATARHRRARAAERRSLLARFEAVERLAESERRRAGAERLALVGQLTAGVAHEVNSPLAYVTSSVRFLEEEATARGPVPPDDERAFHDALEGLVRIQQIVQDLSTFARGGAADGSASCAPREAVLEAVRIASLRFRQGVHVEHHVPGDSPAVGISQGRLVQVLVNLLVNAADALEGPTGAAQRVISVRAEQAAPGQVQLSVEDSGPGIPEAALARLFEPFFTTKGSRGTGLGLALCREYLHAVGGQIAVANRPEGGARFTLQLPTVGPPAAGAGRGP